MKTWQKILSVLAVLALAYPVILYCSQMHLILFPDKLYLSPSMSGMSQFIEKPFTAKDGLSIMGWYHKGDSDKPALLFFHGNSGQIAKFAPSLKPYLDAGFPVYMSEYRGFGGVLGEFNDKNLYGDALRAYEFLHDDLKHDKIIVFGYSMGTAAATYVAANSSSLGLILAAPFYSLRTVAGEQHVPLAPKLLKFDLPSYLFMQHYHGPLLIVHGTDDTLIAPKHGNKLFLLSPSLNKEFKLIFGQSHNALFFGSKAHEVILDWLYRQGFSKE